MELLDGNGGSLIPRLNASTGPNGSYRFNVTPGCQYKVKFIPPSGKFFSPKDQAGNDTKDSDADPKTGQTDAITPKTDDINSGWDAGLFSYFISGTANWDKNKNGEKDTGEQTISSCKINISSNNSTYSSYFTTDINDTYIFTDLPVGKTYTVTTESVTEYILTSLSGGSSSLPIDDPPTPSGTIYTGKDSDFYKPTLVVANNPMVLPASGYHRRFR